VSPLFLDGEILFFGRIFFLSVWSKSGYARAVAGGEFAREASENRDSIEAPPISHCRMIQQCAKVRVEGGARSSPGIGACYEAVACRRETDDSVACNPDSRA